MTNNADSASPGEGWEPRYGGDGRLIGWLKDGQMIPALRTCPKCGARAVAFNCSERGCPVNGGAAYG